MHWSEAVLTDVKSPGWDGCFRRWHNINLIRVLITVLIVGENRKTNTLLIHRLMPHTTMSGLRDCVGRAIRVEPVLKYDCFQ